MPGPVSFDEVSVEENNERAKLMVAKLAERLWNRENKRACIQPREMRNKLSIKPSNVSVGDKTCESLLFRSCGEFETKLLRPNFDNEVPELLEAR